MIKAVTIHNFSNSTKDLVLTLASPESSQGFAIVDMDGLGPVQASYKSDDWAVIDGARLSAMHTSKREIQMELRFIPENSESISDVRQKSYKYFPITKKVGLTFDCFNHIGKTAKYYIEGYVVKNEQTMWSNECGCEITIVCPDPYFSDVKYTEDKFVNTTPKMSFEFPSDNMELDANNNFPVSERNEVTTKELINPSSIDIGAIFTLKALGPVKNPIIYNETTYEQFGLNYEMKTGDVIEIDTRVGHKSIVLKEGLGKNFISKMAFNSNWITLAPGSNMIGVTCSSGGGNLELSYKLLGLYIGL